MKIGRLNRASFAKTARRAMFLFVFAALGTPAAAGTGSVDFAAFVDALKAANNTFDGSKHALAQGGKLTVKWSPVSGCYDKRAGHECTVGNVAATANTPKRVNSGLTQFQLFEGESHAVNVKNVAFVYEPAAFTVCENSGWKGTFTAEKAPAGQIYLMNTGDVTFEGCTFDKVVLTSFNCTGTSTVKDCSFKNVYNSYAVKDIRGATISVTGCTFENCGAAVMVSSTVKVGAVTISGNTFKNVDVAGTAPESKVGTRGLVQIASSGDYAETAFDFSGNTATDCGPVLRQLNTTVSFGTEEKAQLNTLASAGGSLYTTDSIKRVVAKVGETAYETLDEAIEAVQDGETIVVNAGEYKLNGSLTYTGKAFTIQAAEGATVSFDMSAAVALHGAKITFSGVTFNYKTNKDYTGLQHADTLVYNDCTVNGKVFLYAASETFNRCTFTQTAVDYNVWTYGAKAVTFNGCTFNCVGKSVLVYNEGSISKTELAVSDCEFKASAPVEGKAAIEIDTSLMAGGATITVDAKTTAEGFAEGSNSKNTLWNDKKQKQDTNKNTTVTVAGETVFTPIVAQVGEKTYTTLAAALADVAEGKPLTWVAEGAWPVKTPVYYNGTFYETETGFAAKGALERAIDAANAAGAAAVAKIYVRPGFEADELVLQEHQQLKTGLAIYGNDAKLSCNWEPCVEYPGTSGDSGAHQLTKDVSLAIYNLHNGAGFWGRRTTAYTVDLKLSGCQNAHQVMFYGNADTGVKGKTNISVTNCTFDATNKETDHNVLVTIGAGKVDVSDTTFTAANINVKNVDGGDNVITVKDCVFKDTVAGNQNIRVRSYVEGTHADLTIENVTFTGDSTQNVEIGDSKAECKGVVNYTITQTSGTMNVYKQGVTTAEATTLDAAVAYSGDNVGTIADEKALRRAFFAAPTDGTAVTVTLGADITLETLYAAENFGTEKLDDNAAGDTFNRYKVGVHPTAEDPNHWNSLVTGQTQEQRLVYGAYYHMSATDERIARLVVKAGQKIVLDLNGHTIQKNARATHGDWSEVCTDIIGNYGTLEIMDSSTGAKGTINGIGYISCQGAVLHNYKDATMTVTGVNVDGNAAGMAKGTDQYAIANEGGTLTLDGVNVHDTATSASLIMSNGGTVTIKNATLSHPATKVINAKGGVINIESASVTSEEYAVFVTGDARVNVNGSLTIEGTGTLCVEGDAAALTKKAGVELPAPAGFTWVENDGVQVLKSFVAKVGKTAYVTIAEAYAALNAENHTLTLLNENAWDAATPVYWAAGTQSGYVETLTEALTAAYKANAGEDADAITIVCRPGADVGTMTHGHVADDLTIYGNNAFISGGECDLEVDTYTFSRATGAQAADGVCLDKNITITAYELDNLGVWGERHTAHTVTVNLTDCDGKALEGKTNVQRVYISGTTGVNNITLTGCDFLTKATAVYSNADGAITAVNCSFTDGQVPFNINHKANGKQTVAVENCTFTNCGDAAGDWKQFAAPLRLVNSGTGTQSAEVTGCAFAGTVGANGDILLGDGRTGQASNDVELKVVNTKANIQAQKPGYYGGETVDETKKAKAESPAEGTLETSVAKLLPGHVVDENGNVTISDEESLFWFAEQVNVGGNTFAGKTVSLAADITLTAEWTPVGVSVANSFKGTFDGKDHKITGLNVSGSEYVGLIGVLDGGTVKNVQFASVDVSGGTDAGSAVGRIVNNGTVDHVKVLSGTVRGTKRVGGVVGSIKACGTVKNCENAAKVEASTYNVGGIVGAAYYTETGKEMYITDCRNTADITSAGVGAGGIVGLSCANVSGNTNTGAVKGQEVGGIVGEQKTYGSVTGNTNSGAVTNTGTGNYGTGGIIGWLRYHGTDENAAYPQSAIITVSGNSNSGTITGANDAGGIVGVVYNSAVITDNSNTAATLSGTTFAAGIVGNYQITETPAAVEPAKNKLTFTGNTSTTTLDNITANNKDLLIYDNRQKVAQIGDKKYATLAEAVEAAKIGDTIKVIANDASLSVPEGWTISGSTLIPVDKTWHIANLDQLKEFQSAVNGGNTFDGQTVVLDAGIDMASVENWQPIGNASEKKFAGTFDGQNHTISGLKITGGSYVGLFGYLGAATVRNVALVGANVGGVKRVGALVGQIAGNATIKNCSLDATSSVTGSDSNTGGLIGEASGSIVVTLENLTNEAPVTNTENGTSRAAGILCQATSGASVTLKNCVNNGTITTNGGYAGGIVSAKQGGASLVFDGCSNTGTLANGTKGTGDLLAWSCNGSSVTISNYSGDVANAIGWLSQDNYDHVFVINGVEHYIRVAKAGSGYTFASRYEAVQLMDKSYLQEIIGFFDYAKSVNNNFAAYPATPVEVLKSAYSTRDGSIKGSLFNTDTSSGWPQLLSQYNEKSGKSLTADNFAVTWGTRDVLFMVADPVPVNDGSEAHPYSREQFAAMTRAEYREAQKRLGGTLYVNVGNYAYEKNGVLGNGVRNDTTGQVPDHSKLNAYGENGYLGGQNDGANGHAVVFVGGTITSGVTGYTSIDNIGTSLLLAVPAYTKVTFKGTAFKNVLSFDYQLYTSPWSQLGGLTFKDCTFDGIIVGAIASQELAFNGCTFKNYVNTTDANSSNPTWIRPAYGNWTKGDNEGQGTGFRSLTKITFENNTVTSTRPVKFERIAQWEMATTVTATGNTFAITPQAGDTSPKNVGLYFGANAKFDLVVDKNEKSGETAALYTAVYSAPNGGTYVGLPAGSTVKNAAGEEVATGDGDALAWKTTKKITLKTTEEVASVTNATGVSVNFATLSEAVKAAQAGETVTLLADITLASKQSISKELTLDLNGKTLTGTAYQTLSLGRGANVTIQDSSAEKTGKVANGYKGSADPYTICLDGYGAAALTLVSGTVEANPHKTDLQSVAINTNKKDGPYAINITGGKVLVPESSTDGRAIVASKNTTLNITGGEIVGGLHGVDVYDGSTTTITGGSISARAVDTGVIQAAYGLRAKGTASVIIGAADGAADVVSVAGIKMDDNGYKLEVPAVTVNSGTIAGPVYSITKGTIVFNVQATSEDVLRFADDTAAKFLPSNLELRAKDIDGKTMYYVAAKPVAAIGAVGYETLEAALAAAKDGETVKLLADVTESVTIAADRTLTLDLNGKTLSAGKASEALTVTGHLTIDDTSAAKSGRVVGDVRYAVYMNNRTAHVGEAAVGGSLTLNAGSLEGATYGVYILANQAAFTMNGGKVSATQAESIRVNNDYHAKTISLLGGEVGDVFLGSISSTELTTLTVGKADQTAPAAVKVGKIGLQYNRGLFRLELYNGLVGELPEIGPSCTATYTALGMLVKSDANCPSGKVFEKIDYNGETWYRIAALQKIAITFDDSKTVALPFATDWLKAHVGEGEASWTTEALEEKAANGLAKWQCYLFGLDPNKKDAKVVATAGQGTDEAIPLTVANADASASPLVTGGYVTVAYVLMGSNDRTAWTQVVTSDKRDGLKIPLTGTPYKFYRVDVTVTSAEGN